MFIPMGFCNVTWVISRTGDLDPYTTSLATFMNSGAFNQADADSFATALRTASLPSLSSGDTLVSIDFAYNEGGGVVQYSAPQGQVGTGSPLSNCTSQNCAALIQKRTGTPGRKGRGRMYWPYLGETDVDGIGLIAPGAKTRMQTMINGWNAAVGTATSFDAFYVLHQISTPEPSKVTQLTPASLLATQRRRLRK